MSRQFAPNTWGLTLRQLGLAVKEVDAAIAYLTGLGYRAGSRVFDPLQNVHIAMFTHDAMPEDVEVIYPAAGEVPRTKTGSFTARAICQPISTLPSKRSRRKEICVCSRCRPRSGSSWREACFVLRCRRRGPDRDHRRQPGACVAHREGFFG